MNHEKANYCISYVVELWNMVDLFIRPLALIELKKN